MTKPKVQNPWNDLNKFYSPNIFFAYLQGQRSNAQVLIFVLNSLRKAEFFTEFGERSHHLLPNVWRSNGNQSVKFGRLIKDSLRNIFQKSCRQCGRETSSRPLCFLKRLFVKAIGQHLSFNIFWLTSTWTYSKNKFYNISDCWSRETLNFDFL